MSEKMGIVQLIGLANGETSPFDGQYLVEYDPTRQGHTPDGKPMICHLVTTPDCTKATRYTTDAASLLYQWTDGERPDGQPNRPLTAFHIIFEAAEPVDAP